jgi:protein-S-isoprenylcysteine O-methyltransferase Ste14
MDPLRLLWLPAMIVGVLPFADSFRLTLGQSYLVQRSRDRLSLAALEIGLIVAWGVLRWGARLDLRLLPADNRAAGAVAGLVLTLIGAGLSAWAKLQLGPWFTGTFGVKPGHVLVTRGPYAVTRHPIYTGVIAMVGGSALVWDSALTLALAIVLVAPLWRHTVIEERLFVEHFGDAYRRYQRRVPRLVPWKPLSREER